jgi:hypothetical protein
MMGALSRTRGISSTLWGLQPPQAALYPHYGEFIHHKRQFFHIMGNLSATSGSFSTLWGLYPAPQAIYPDYGDFIHSRGDLTTR